MFIKNTLLGLINKPGEIIFINTVPQKVIQQDMSKTRKVSPLLVLYRIVNTYGTS